MLLAKTKRMTTGKDEQLKNPKGKNISKQGVIATPNHHFQPKNVYKKWNLSHYLWLFVFVAK